MEEEQTNQEETCLRPDCIGTTARQVDDDESKGHKKFISRFPLKLNFATFNFTIVIAFIILGVSYLVISNYLISRGFSLNEKKTKVEQLKKENRELELTVMNLESYSAVEERIAALEMINVGEIEYIEAKDESVAMK